MSEYAKKTCYDCGVREPANQMERVTESYNSGRSDNKVTAGNLAWATVSNDAAKKVKKTIVANNRRSYTRNRTVWKCQECSGTADWQRGQVVEFINKATKEIAKAQKGGVFSAPKTISDEVHNKMHELNELSGMRSNKTAKELLDAIQAMIKTAPEAGKSGWGKFSDEVRTEWNKEDPKVQEAQTKYDAKVAESKAKVVEKMEQAKETSRAQTEKLAPITNFMLSVFAFAGYALVTICVLGVLLEATNGTLSGDNGVGAIVLGAVGYGIVRLCKRSKR